MEFDPVLPKELDGVCCEMQSGSRLMRYEFTSSSDGRKRIMVNSVILSQLQPLENPHRTGGVRTRRGEFEAQLRPGVNLVQMEV